MKRSTHLYINGIAFLAAVCCLLLAASKAKVQWNQLGGTDTSAAKTFITPLAIDAGGNLYADMFSGLKSAIAKWDGKMWTKLSTGNADLLQSKTLTTGMNRNIYIAESHKDEMGILHNHVVKWSGKSWVPLGSDNDTTFNDKFIESIVVDHNGYVYAAVSVQKRNEKKSIRRYGYVLKWDSKAWSIVGGKDGFTINDGNTEIKTLIADASGDLFAAGSLDNDQYGQNSFVAKWDGKAWDNLSKSQSKLQGNLEDLIIDSKGNLYAMLGFGNMIPVQYISKWDGRQWRLLVNKSAPRFNGLCTSITTDAAGTVYTMVTGMDFQSGKPQKNYVAEWDGTGWKELADDAVSPLNNSKNKFGTMIKIMADDKGDLIAMGTFYNDNGKYYLAKYRQ